MSSIYAGESLDEIPEYFYTDTYVRGVACRHGTSLSTQALTRWTTTLPKSSSSVGLSARPSPLWKTAVGAGLECNQSRDGKRRQHKWCGGLRINLGGSLGRGRGAALAGWVISLAV